MERSPCHRGTGDDLGTDSRNGPRLQGLLLSQTGRPAQKAGLQPAAWSHLPSGDPSRNSVLLRAHAVFRDASCRPTRELLVVANPLGSRPCVKGIVAPF